MVRKVELLLNSLLKTLANLIVRLYRNAINRMNFVNKDKQPLVGL